MQIGWGTWKRRITICFIKRRSLVALGHNVLVLKCVVLWQPGLASFFVECAFVFLFSSDVYNSAICYSQVCKYHSGGSIRAIKICNGYLLNNLSFLSCG